MGAGIEGQPELPWPWFLSLIKHAKRAVEQPLQQQAAGMGGGGGGAGSEETVVVPPAPGPLLGKLLSPPQQGGRALGAWLLVGRWHMTVLPALRSLGVLVMRCNYAPRMHALVVLSSSGTIEPRMRSCVVL